MPGVLSHLTAALIGFWIVFFIFRKSENKLFYGFAFIIGTVIPDAIKFGIPGIKLETASYYKILQDPLFWTLNYYTHNIVFWIIFFLVVLVIAFLLYKFKKIDKIRLRVWVVGNIIFLMAIVIHLIMDFYIHEKSYWI